MTTPPRHVVVAPGPPALVLGTLTALALAWSGWSVVALGGGMVYLALTAGTLRRPALLVPQLLAGAGLTGLLLVGPEGIGALRALPIVVGLVATAELLATAERTGVEGGRPLARAGRTALGSGGVFGLVALAAGIPGPGGLAAVAVATGACLGAAALVVRSAH